MDAELRQRRAPTSPTSPPQAQQTPQQQQPTSWLAFLISLGFSIPGRLASYLVTLFRSIAGSIVPHHLLPFALESRPLSSRLREQFPDLPLASYRDIVKLENIKRECMRDICYGCIYIHSDQHPDTDAFVRTVLANPEIQTLITEKAGAWAIDATSPSATHLLSLGFTQLPALVVVVPSDNSLRLAGYIQGVDPAAPAHLAAIFQQFEPLLISQQADRDAVNQSRLLREEQDREYFESMETDRRKAEERKQRAEREAQEANVVDTTGSVNAGADSPVPLSATSLADVSDIDAASDAEMDGDVDEEEEPEVVDDALVEALQASLVGMVPDEPSEDEPRLCIAFQVPGAGRMQRFFAPDNTVKVLYAYVRASGKMAPLADVSLSIQLRGAKQVLDNMDQTVQDLTGGKRVLIFCQDLAQ
eukprot:m.47387 g.47387  ORF g.47387 m.47387 type:complete len:417 (-) comp10975_c0_seq1:2698-3948(-)